MADDRTCRYFVTDRRGLTLWNVAYGVRSLHPGFRVGDLIEPNQKSCHLSLRGEALAKISVIEKAEPAFASEADAARAMLGKGKGAAHKQPVDAINRAGHVLVVNLMDHGIGPENPKGPLQPLWSWLLDHREGVLLASARGFFMGRVPSEEDELDSDPTH